MNNRVIYKVSLLTTTLAFNHVAEAHKDFPVEQGACTRTAEILKVSCLYDAYADFYKSLADCKNISDNSERYECQREAKAERKEVKQECRTVSKSRSNLCDYTGEAAYEPEFGEDYTGNFVDPTEIGKSVAPNPYFPLVAGNQWVYEATGIDEEGEVVSETITVSVTDETKLIDGVTCLVVKDIVASEGDLIEDTDDWYAQDKAGNVWYCGEIARNYENFDGDDPEEAELTDVDGSWKAGRDGAKAGISLLANPEQGQLIRQEVLWKEAEDVILIDDLMGTEQSPAASCDNDCLVTRDFSPLEPGIVELKYYLPGVGKIVETNLTTGERTELIEFTRNP